MAQSIEPIEAVIISGPRKGEIIRLPDDALAGLSNEDIKSLDDALDDLIMVIDRVSKEVRATTAALKEDGEAA